LPHRQKSSRIGEWHIFDDCYNANPEATKAALDTVVELARGKPVIAVLGEMRELGLEAADYHREVGRYAASLPVHALISVGQHAGACLAGAKAAGLAEENCEALEKAEDVAPAVCRRSPPGSWVLFKASRGLRLELAIEALREMV
jgi:UDP-N-acetylmuramyl pentapeptide synthase